MKPDNVTVDPAIPPAEHNGAVQATLFEALQPVFDLHGPSRAYYQRFFQLCVDHFQPWAATLEIRIRVEVASHQYLAPSIVDRSEQADLKDQLEACSTQVLLDEVAQPQGLSAVVGDRDVRVVGVGLQDLASGEVRGSLVLAVPAHRLEDARLLRHELSMFCAVAMSLEGTAQQEPASASPPAPDWQRALQKSGGYGSARELAFALANSLSNKFQCEHVGIGIVRRNRSEILAISGLATFKANSPGVVEMRAAMDECQDFGRVMIVQPGGDPEAHENLPLHRQWSRSAGDTPVCSIPLLIDNECVAVASLRFPTDRVLTKQDHERFAANVMPFAHAFRMLYFAGRTLTTHASDTVRDHASKWLRPKSASCRALLMVAVMTVAWFVFGVLPYKPLCTAELVPRELRHVSAPFAGQLDRVHVQAGDHVKAGQPLIEFDVHALQLELSALQAEIAASEVELRHSLDQSDASAAALARADLAVNRAKAVAVQDRIGKAVIVAPSDGMVMQCNLRQHIGATLARGDALLQFAPQHGWDVEIQVPDAVAPFVTVKQDGTFATSSHPGQAFDFKIRQVSGSAEMRGGKNIFVADAPLQGDLPWMRSGMEGVAQIKTVWKPVWWVALHSVIDNLRLKFWM